MPISCDWLDHYPGVRALLQGDDEILDACAEDAPSPPPTLAQTVALTDAAYRAAVRQQRQDADVLALLRTTVATLEAACTLLMLSEDDLERLAAAHGLTRRRTDDG
jgi:hypothetical protein